MKHNKITLFKNYKSSKSKKQITKRHKTKEIASGTLLPDMLRRHDCVMMIWSFKTHQSPAPSLSSPVYKQQTNRREPCQCRQESTHLDTNPCNDSTIYRQQWIWHPPPLPIHTHTKKKKKERKRKKRNCDVLRLGLQTSCAWVFFAYGNTWTEMTSTSTVKCTKMLTIPLYCPQLAQEENDHSYTVSPKHGGGWFVLTARQHTVSWNRFVLLHSKEMRRSSDDPTSPESHGGNDESLAFVSNFVSLVG